MRLALLARWTKVVRFGEGIYGLFMNLLVDVSRGCDIGIYRLGVCLIRCSICGLMLGVCASA